MVALPVVSLSDLDVHGHVHTAGKADGQRQRAGELADES